MRSERLTNIYDIAVVGSGFAGSLMAMIARRQGHSVILLEKGKHPRMAIGESSTPLANLLLEELATCYDLPFIKPLTKWGSWQRSYPAVACGLKRGFTFYHHQLGVQDAHDPNRENQLLVAASPHGEISDTHWYRADFDELLTREAQTLGVVYVDEIALNNFVEYEDGMVFDGARQGISSTYRVKFVVDATGPRGLLHRALNIPEAAYPGYPATRALYSHFSGVVRPAKSLGEEQPYPAEDAAVHHVFDGGWIWVLRFNNGITSAGVAATEEASARLRLQEGEPAWRRLLNSIPALREQFASAKAVQPFTYLPHVSYMSSRVCGRRWAMLPSAAGFVDPLLSTGFPLTLLGVSRLAAILSDGLQSANMQSRLKTYATQTKAELLATADLIGGLYANMNNFPVFKAISLLYFAAASYSETARRLHKPHLAQSFLLHDHPEFGPACIVLLDRALRVRPGAESVRLTEDIRRAIEPFDVAGLTDLNKRSWYPVVAEDLLKSASKVDSTRGEVESLLDRCGFYLPA
jgi:FADH2 O2-dependent halogenase